MKVQHELRKRLPLTYLKKEVYSWKRADETLSLNQFFNNKSKNSENMEPFTIELNSSAFLICYWNNSLSSVTTFLNNKIFQKNGKLPAICFYPSLYQNVIEGKIIFICERGKHEKKIRLNRCCFQVWLKRL